MRLSKPSPLHLALAGICAFFTGAVVFVSSRYFFRVCDDAYISFRYARNLAEGHGLVFNLGEYVEGYTNFLWVLVLSLVHLAERLTGIDALSLALFVSIVCACGCIGLLTRLMRDRADGQLRWLAAVPALLLAVDNTFIVNAMMGLEGPLLILLVLLFVRALVAGPLFRGELGLIVTAVMFTRLDGIVMIAGALGVWLLITSRTELKERLTSLYFDGALLAICLVSWFGWRFWYYGALLPNTFYLKVPTPSGVVAARGLTYLHDYLAANWYVPSVILVAWYLVRNRSLSLLTGAALAQVCYVVFVVGGDFYPFSRFLLLLPVTTALALGLLIFEASRQAALRGGWAAGGDLRLTLVVTVLVSGLALKGGMLSGPYAREVVPFAALHEGRARLGEWLRTVATPSDSILLKAIGSVGYYSGMRVVDTFGILHPEVARRRVASLGRGKPGHEKYMSLRDIMRYAPTFVSFDTYRKTIPDWRPYGYYFSAEFPPSLFKHRAVVGPGIWRFDPHLKNPSRWRLLFNFEGETRSLRGWRQTSPYPAFRVDTLSETRRGQLTPRLFEGSAYLSSFDPKLGDRATGSIESPDFVIKGKRLCLLVAGGRDKRRLRVELRVNSRTVRQITGSGSEYFGRRCFHTDRYQGFPAVLRVIDESTSRWGHLMIDEFTERRR